MDVISKTIKESWIIKIIYAYMIVVLLLLKPTLMDTIDTSYLTVYIFFFFIAIIIHFISLKDKNWFRLDVLFLLGYGIVHFQWAIMLAISNITPPYLLRDYIDSDYMNYGTWLSTVGILMWFIGYFWFPSKKKNSIKYQLDYKKLLWFSVILFILFLGIAGSNFLTGGFYKGQGGASTGEGISIYFQLLFGISIIVLTAIVLLDNKSNYKTKIIPFFLGLNKKYLILAGTFVLLFLSIGDRGGPMQLTLTFLILFGSLVRPISLKEFSLIIVAGAIVLTLVGLGRSADTGENILVAGANKAEFTSNYDATIELANSVNTLYSVLSNVPEHHDYFLGKIWLGKFFAVIPFSQNIYLQLSDDKFYELGSANYITFLRHGLNPPYGEGSSLVADIYLNFGLIGVIFLMFILGLFFKKLQNELDQQTSYYWIITAAFLASVAFYMGRGGLFDMLRPILWGLVLATLFVKNKEIV